MNAIILGLLVIIPVFLIFSLALCKSAALADREMESLLAANQSMWLSSYDQAESKQELIESTEHAPDSTRDGVFAA